MDSEKENSRYRRDTRRPHSEGARAGYHDDGIRTAQRSEGTRAGQYSDSMRQAQHAGGTRTAQRNDRAQSGQKKNGAHNFIVQGSILAIAGIVCRIIGMFYRIPLIDIIGTKGNGYYTSAYSIYNILLIVSSYSLPLAISKLISVRLANNRYEDVKRVLRIALLYATLAGGAMFAVMFFGSSRIAVMLGKPFCEYALKTLAPTIWIMAYLGVLRGYFQGTGSMVPTAVSQIFEQVVNAVISIVMAYLLFNYGLRSNIVYSETEYSYAFGAAGGTIGTGAGAATALIFFIIMLLIFGRTIVPADRGALRADGSRAESRRRTESYGTVMKTLLLTLLPILVSSTIYNISTVLDDFIFSNAMNRIGMAASVVLLWGVFGEYRILFNIPVAIANSMSSSVIPSLSNAVAVKDRRLIVTKIRLSIQFTMLIAIPAAVGMAVLADPICNLLYHGQDNATLINVLRLGSIAIIFFSLSTITNAILQGLGHLTEPLINSALSLIIHIGVLFALILVCRLSLYAVIIANIVFAAVVSLFNDICIHKHVKFHSDFKKTFIAPLIASAVMGVAAMFIYLLISILLPQQLLKGRVGLLIALMPAIGAAVIIYLIMLLLLRAFTKEELIEMPMGRTLYSIASRLRLM